MKEHRPPLTKERILDAALALADQGGIEALSMRKLGEELGVRAMSLYNHVTNKEELVSDLLERIVADFELPEPAEPWKEAMRRRGRSAYQVLKKHPWAIQELMTSSNAGPNMLRYVDATLGCLVEAGFSYESADHLWHAMDNHIYGYTLQEMSFPFQEKEYADTAREFLPRIATDTYPYFTHLARMVMNREYSGVHDFNFGLDLILDGSERYLIES